MIASCVRYIQRRLAILPPIDSAMPGQPVHANAGPETRWLDQSEIRTQQALGPLLLIAAYIADDWRLVAAQCVFFLLTALRYDLGPYVLLYRSLLKPLGIVKPDIRADNPEAHRFATAFGFVVLAVATYLVATGHTIIGWSLVWALVILGGIGFFGWCAGCFMYYVINRFGGGRFFRHAPITGTTVPGARPPKSGGR